MSSRTSGAPLPTMPFILEFAQCIDLPSDMGTPPTTCVAGQRFALSGSFIDTRITKVGRETTDDE